MHLVYALVVHVYQLMYHLQLICIILLLKPCTSHVKPINRFQRYFDETINCIYLLIVYCFHLWWCFCLSFSQLFLYVCMQYSLYMYMVCGGGTKISILYLYLILCKSFIHVSCTFCYAFNIKTNLPLLYKQRDRGLAVVCDCSISFILKIV